MNDQKEARAGLPLKKIILIAVPSLLIILGAVVFYKVTQINNMRKETEQIQNAALAVSAEEALTTAAVTAEPEETSPALIPLGLTAGSTADCLNIVVIAPENSVPEGFIFPIRIIFPDGSERSYSTDGDGKLLVSGLSAGQYKLNISPIDGFDTSCGVSCTVEGIYAYEPIENISQQAVITQISEAPADEVKPASAESQAVEVEVLVTSQTTDQAVYDFSASGNPDTGAIVIGSSSPDAPSTAVGSSLTSWKYTFQTGASGTILKADGSESDVFPVLDLSGNLSYGLKKITTYFNAQGQVISSSDIADDAVDGVDYYIEESSEYVTLIFGNGAYNTDFLISATQTADEQKLVTGWQEIGGKLYYLDSTGTRVTGLKNIDGKLYLFNADGSKKGALGVDVSYWNHDINFYAVKNNGIDFAIVRLGYRGYESGILYEDGNSYKEMENGGCYLQEAVAAGMGVGGYFYSSATNTNEAVEEASLAIEIIKASGVNPGYPIYIDMEDSGMFPGGRADKLTADQRTEIINAFCLTVSAAGYTPGLYCSENYYYYRINSAALVDCKLWIANYSDNYSLPGISGWDLWQFTSSARINGIVGGSDLNVLPD